ncbi:serine/threonine-protein kinase [Streptomyces sp. NPDC051567]|uniref:serine/threonine-protein kinase n=1 Tax=Streptomyces sp. NPDC051567 TaxID=3365660 RepID=UPI003798AAC0
MEPLTDTDPERIGVHVLVARLGAGGMGQVYLGRSPGGRLVAVKVVRDEIVGNPQALARFRREVETVRAVRSAYTANLIDASLEEPPFWLVTEYVSGPTLAHAVRARGPLSARTCGGLAAALAEGLASVHAYGVTHRDLKPQNVILGAQGPQLIDFGIARGIGTTALTREGQAMGTPGFTAPEVLLGAVAGDAADVFALGATLAYAATGRPPFGGGAVATVGYRTVHEPVDVAGVEPALAALIGACTAKDPAARPTPAEVIRRCGVRDALVEDPQYAALALPAPAPAPAHRLVPDLADPADRPAPPGLPADGPPTVRGPAPVAGGAAPGDAGAGTGTGTVAEPRRGRGRAGRWVAVGLVFAAAGSVALWKLLPGPVADPAAGPGPAGSAAAPAPAVPPVSASASASGRPGKKAVDFRWKLSSDPARAMYRAGECDREVEGDPPGAGIQTSTVTSHTNGVTAGTAKVRMRAERGAKEGSRPAPYLVVAAVKPPGPVAVPADRPAGFLSEPVDLYATWDSGDYGELSYPGDFPGAVPLAEKEGDWTVVFYHAEDGPKRYTSISCGGFRVGR